MNSLNISYSDNGLLGMYAIADGNVMGQVSEGSFDSQVSYGGRGGRRWVGERRELGFNCPFLSY